MPIILAMIDTYRINGPSRGLLQLVKGNQSSTIRFLIGMFLVGSCRTSPAIEECNDRGIEVAVWSQKRRYDAWLIYKAWKTVREHKVSILQSHGYKPAVVACCLKYVTGLPWVAVMHGHTNENKRVALYNRLDLWVARAADRVIAVSEATACFLNQKGIQRDRIRVIPNAIDPRSYQPGKTGIEFRQSCGVGSDHLLVGVIGRLSPEKGGAVFLRALENVVRAIPAVRAVLVGEGQEAERLKTLARSLGLKGRVTFAGYHGDISHVYSALDLVVIPSISEGLPNVLLEAFLHQKAVVATAVGGIPEVMQGELSSWLVPPGDVQALSDAIIRAVRCPKLCAELGKAGAKLVRGRFTPAQRADQFLSVYEELIPTQKSPSWVVEHQQP